MEAWMEEGTNMLLCIIPTRTTTRILLLINIIIIVNAMSMIRTVLFLGWFCTCTFSFVTTTKQARTCPGTKTTLERRIPRVVLWQESSSSNDKKKKQKKHKAKKKPKTAVDVGTFFSQIFTQWNDLEHFNTSEETINHDVEVNKQTDRIVMPKKQTITRGGDPDPHKNSTDFQQRLLEARLKQDQKESSSSSSQKSVKHIRIIKEYNQGNSASSTRKSSGSGNGDANGSGNSRSTVQAEEEAQKRKRLQFQRRLLAARYQNDANANAKELEQKQRFLNQARQQEQARMKQQQGQFQQRLLAARYQNDAHAKELEQNTKLLNQERARKELQRCQFHQRLLATRYQCEANAKVLELQRLLKQARQQEQARKNQQQCQFQQRLLAARYQNDANAKELEQNTRLLNQERARKELQRSQFHQLLLATRYQCEANAKVLELQRLLNQARQQEQARKNHQQCQFQQRLLAARYQNDANAKELEQQRLLNQELARKKQQQYQFHQRLLAARFQCEAKTKKYKMNKLFKEILQVEQQRKKEEQKIQQHHLQKEQKIKQYHLHKQLLAARYHYQYTAKRYKLKQLLQKIMDQREHERKYAQYQFHKQLLATTLETNQKTREQRRQNMLNSFLQNQQLITYTQKKIAEKAKNRFQRRLFFATLKVQTIEIQKRKRLSIQRKRVQFHQQLMQERMRSDAKKAARKQEQQDQVNFQAKLAELYQSLQAAETTKEQTKRKSEFQQRLLVARIRNDLIAKQRVSKERIDQLRQSLREAQLQSELAAAEATKAEEEKRQAQLEIDKQKIEQDKGEEEKRQAQLEIERQKVEQEALLEQQRKEAIQKQIQESQARQEAMRRQMEDVGRQQNIEESLSGTTMNEYEATMERERKAAAQRRIEEGKRRQEEIQRTMEDAGRIRASEETMDHYEATLQQQQQEAMRLQLEDSKRREENLRRQLENAGRQQAPEDSTSASMNQYDMWMQQGNKTLLAKSAAVSAPPIVSPEEKIRREMEEAGRFQQSTSPVTPQQHSTSTPVPVQQQAVAPAVQPQEQSQLQQQAQQQEEVDSLVGQVLLSKFHVTEKLRVGGDRSELYKCYHVLDDAQQYSLVIKLSHNTEQIELEHRIYGDLFTRLAQDRQQLFVRAYDWVSASPATNGRVGFVMECGLENLRGHVWRHGPYTGDKLRSVMENLIRIVDSLHGLGVVWSELKSENFIVFDGDVIKAVDLESVAAHKECLRAYTAEAYPPEFPAESLYQCLPKIPVDYSFDVWGLGLTLYEIAVGEPLFTLQRTYDVDYIKERLKNPDGIITEANKKMWKLDSGARDIIRQCLVVDPEKRSSCEQLLQDAYFQRQYSNQPPTTASRGTLK
jgi:hypothetical protein